jgi:hypothetical protein
LFKNVFINCYEDFLCLYFFVCRVSHRKKSVWCLPFRFVSRTMDLDFV